MVSKEACDIGEFFLAKTARDDISNQATEGSEILREMNVYNSGKVISQELVIVRKPL